MIGDDDRRTLTVMVVPDDGGETHTFALSYRRLRVFAVGAIAFGIVVTLMASSWWYFAARAMRTSELERQVAEMSGDRERIEALAEDLGTIEEQYDQIRDLFGSAETEEPTGVWLPPVVTDRTGEGSERPLPTTSRPSAWPLVERGFVTQGLHAGTTGDHPGLDIAVPSDSYIRAAGGGTVSDVGEDAVYGRFVIIDHGDGYATLYGHASTTFVALGQTVRERQVIALSGSTGRSTGPHLHFEVLVEGEPVDPLTFVQQPG